MMTKKSESGNCPLCQSNPCQCVANACGTMKSCMGRCGGWGWAIVRIAIVVLLIVGAFCAGKVLGNHDGRWETKSPRDRDRVMIETCRTIPNAPMCEVYRTDAAGTPVSPAMRHDMMDMSMMDMSNMLAGKTGDDLNKAFLEGMIPHHQAAVNMAKYLAGSNKPELVKLGADIITAQTKEIEQMKAWQQAWGYTSTGTTSTGMMMQMGTGMMDHSGMMRR